MTTATKPKRKRLFDADVAERPLFDDPPPAQRRPPATEPCCCAVCESQTIQPAGATAPPLCAFCRQNPCLALDILEELTISCEERLAKVWAPLEKVINRASDAERLRYYDLWNKRVEAAVSRDHKRIAELNDGVWNVRNNPDIRTKSLGLALILDAEAGLLEAIETQHITIHRELDQLREAQYELIGLRDAKDWRIPEHLTARRLAIPQYERPRPLLMETTA